MEQSLPYSQPPWNYNGTENVASLPAGVVDWVLVELRTGTASTTTVSKRAAFIKSNGTIVDLDGTSSVQFNNTSPGYYYIVVRHRNHLAIMSATTMSLTIGNSIQYDFTPSQGFAYGTNPMKLVGTRYCMYAGDGNGDGGADAIDRNTVWRPQNGFGGYLAGDFNLDGGTDAIDRNTMWRPNNGTGTQVP